MCNDDALPTPGNGFTISAEAIAMTHSTAPKVEPSAIINDKLNRGSVKIRLIPLLKALL